MFLTEFSAELLGSENRRRKGRIKSVTEGSLQLSAPLDFPAYYSSSEGIINKQTFR